MKNSRPYIWYMLPGLIFYTAFMILPFLLIFEFLVPIIEFFGIIALIAGIITEKINTEYLIIVSVFVYLFYLLITLVSIMIDDLLYKSYANYKELQQGHADGNPGGAVQQNIRQARRQHLPLQAPKVPGASRCLEAMERCYALRLRCPYRL